MKPRLQITLDVPLDIDIETAASVPCDGCRLCCQRWTAVTVSPILGDDVSQYLTTTHPSLPGALVLQHKPNGDCVYLGEQGCTIHGRTPYVCRHYDCRAQHEKYTKAQRDRLVKRGLLDPLVLRRAAILIHRAQKAATPERKK